MTDLVAARDEHSTPTWGLEKPASTDCVNFQLTGGTEQTVTVPADTRLALFVYTPGLNVFVANRAAGAITVPTGTPATDETELLPILRDVEAGDTLRFISAPGENAFVQIRWFRR